MKKIPKIFALSMVVFGLISFKEAFSQDAPAATAPATEQLVVADPADAIPPPIQPPIQPPSGNETIAVPAAENVDVAENPPAPTAENVDAAVDPNMPVDPNASIMAPDAASALDLNSPFEGSLFYSNSEVGIIRDALSGHFREDVSLPTDSVDGVPIPLANPLISISGVLYRGPGNWVVWMNGQKVTPGNLLPELVDIDVQSSSYVRFKWYDSTRQKLATVNLRPHQTYDISTDITWPGTP